MSSMPREHFLTARRSGDEFCMMIYACQGRDEIAEYLTGFYEELAQNQIQLSAAETRTISASAGFAWTADDNSLLSELLGHADEALYEVKRDRKGTFGEYAAGQAASF